MGIRWKFAMPLLSTLAALVIIVHSAEEGLDREHRYDLRPRVLDTRPSYNEQPWRVVRSEPLMQLPTTPPNTWSEDSQDEPPVRRRVGRKRKRRPPSPLGETDSIPVAHKANYEEEETNIENTETPGKRRKRIRPNRWTDEPRDTDRPIRRRGQRRKRPSLDTWPELSEFGAYPRNKKIHETDREAIIQTDLDDDDISNQQYSHRSYGNDDEVIIKEIRTESRRPVSDSRFVKADENKNEYKRPKEDKSLSEFSEEVLGPLEQQNTDGDEYDYRELRGKMEDKAPGVFQNKNKIKEKTLSLELDKYFDFKSDYVSFLLHNGDRNKNKNLYAIKEFIEEIKSQDKMDNSVDLRNILSDNNQIMADTVKKCKDKLTVFQREKKNAHLKLDIELKREHGAIDALALKDILKRSNGTSLSEILQQHNLTLADLLNGNEKAISVLKSEKYLQNSEKSIEETPIKKGGEIDTSTDEDTKESSENIHTTSQIKNVTLSTTQIRNNEDSFINKDKVNSTTSNENSLLNIAKISLKIEEDNSTSLKQDLISDSLNITKEKSKEEKKSTATPKLEQRTSGMLTTRRFPGAIRRKLRMRPMVNNTYKSQINRDLIALSARRYVHHNRRNITKAKEWKEVVPLMIKLNVTEEIKENIEENLITTTPVPTETTTNFDEIETTISDEPVTVNNVTDYENENILTETTTITVEILATELDTAVTEKPIVTRPPINPAGVRRQSYNNRLKKKRMRQKTSTTEAPQDEIMKNLLELGDLVSSSEFIARTQVPKTTIPDEYTETATELEDFLTTHANKNSIRSTRLPTTRKSNTPTTVTKSPLLSSTEENAKIEIEEILNDTRTSAKLAKILRERNMTLSELFEHRERGSSHVHLADIFHNASREPNPPEPFLTKSLIEPISKETYPLRALLDANLHDPLVKVTTIDPIQTNHVNIPVIMDFGNNVNENAENMGIMSLFNNFTKTAAISNEEKGALQKDSKGTPYKSTVIAVNTTDDDDTTRESRMLDDDQDMISWNEIFSMIRKNHKNETKALEKLTREISPSGSQKKITLEEDVDGDGVIVLEDLQHFKDMDNSVATSSEEKIEFNTIGRAEILEPGILTKTPNSAKSVTVATASIVGLAMILFLLTYAALKWRQQRTMTHKKTLCDDRIPSPVFENRKGTKNCSSRSISPMLPTSNIYSMNTMESQNGKDSPEYMWDTLRKPFQ